MTNDTLSRTEYVTKARREVEDCLERAVQQGWKPTPSVFVSTYDAACCALGAIALCHKDMPTRAEYAAALDDGVYRSLSSDYSCYALSKQHLGCTQWELESIEAGFEGFTNEWGEIPDGCDYLPDIQDAGGRDQSFFSWWCAVAEKLEDGAPGRPFDPDFYRIGADMRAKYYVEETDEDE